MGVFMFLFIMDHILNCIITGNVHLVAYFGSFRKAKVTMIRMLQIEGHRAYFHVLIS